MPTAGELVRRVYGVMVRIPIVGWAVRLPVRAARSVLHPTIQSEVARIWAAQETAIRPSPSYGTDDAVVGALWDTTANMQAQIHGLWQRLEFVRAEAMFEMRAMVDGGKREIGYRMDGNARFRNLDKVNTAIAAGTLKLNVGCGHIPIEGYVNVDGRDLPGVDVVSDASSMPFQPDTVTEVFSSHLLEHFPLEHLRRVVLPHWREILAPGGVLRAIVPDAEGMISDYVNRNMSFDDLREVTYGLQEYEGDFHFNMFSRKMLTQLLEDVGLHNVDYAFVNRKNGKCRDMEIRATKR